MALRRGNAVGTARSAQADGREGAGGMERTRASGSAPSRSQQITDDILEFGFATEDGSALASRQDEAAAAGPSPPTPSSAPSIVPSTAPTGEPAAPQRSGPTLDDAMPSAPEADGTPARADGPEAVPSAEAVPAAAAVAAAATAEMAVTGSSGGEAAKARPRPTEDEAASRIAAGMRGRLARKAIREGKVDSLADADRSAKIAARRKRSSLHMAAAMAAASAAADRVGLGRRGCSSSAAAAASAARRDARRERLAEAERLFDRIDVNGDGTLMRKELLAGLAGHALSDQLYGAITIWGHDYIGP